MSCKNRCKVTICFQLLHLQTLQKVWAVELFLSPTGFTHTKWFVAAGFWTFSTSVFLRNVLQSDWWRSRPNPSGNQFQSPTFGMKNLKTSQILRCCCRNFPLVPHFTRFSGVFEHLSRSTLQPLNMAANVAVINRWLVSLAPPQMVTCFSTVTERRGGDVGPKGREEEEEKEVEGGGCWNWDTMIRQLAGSCQRATALLL